MLSLITCYFRHDFLAPHFMFIIIFLFSSYKHLLGTVNLEACWGDINKPSPAFKKEITFFVVQKIMSFSQVSAHRSPPQSSFPSLCHLKQQLPGVLYFLLLCVFFSHCPHNFLELHLFIVSLLQQNVNSMKVKILLFYLCCKWLNFQIQENFCIQEA